MKNTPAQTVTTTSTSAALTQQTATNSLQDFQRSLFNENPSNFKRSFIEYNQPLMGTGKLMRNPQEVHSTVRLSNIKELKNYVVQLKYAGLVHLCNLEERRKQITGSMDYQPKLTVQDWVLKVLNKVKDTDPSQWLIQRDDTRRHLSYRVTLFQSESLNANGEQQKTGLADRLILSHYGKQEKELEVQTGFPISHAQLESEQQIKGITHIAGTPLTAWKKQTGQTVAPIINPSTDTSAKAQKAAEKPGKSSSASATAQAQVAKTPKTETAKAPNKFIVSTIKIMKELHELTRQAYAQINVIKLTGPNDEAKAHLESYGFETKTLGQLSRDLSDEKNPKLNIENTAERKRAHYIDYHLFLSPSTSEFIHLLDDLRCITSTKLCLETQLEDTSKLVKNGTINSNDKAQLEKLHKQLLKNVDTLQQEVNSFLFPLVHAIGGLLNDYNDHYKKQDDMAKLAHKGHYPLLDFIQNYCKDSHRLDYYAGLLQSITLKANTHTCSQPVQSTSASSPENHQAQAPKQNAPKKPIDKQLNASTMTRYINNLLQLTAEHDPQLKKQNAKKYDEYINAFNTYIQLHTTANSFYDARDTLSKNPGVKDNIRYYSQLEQISPPDLKAHISSDTYNKYVKSYADFRDLYAKVNRVNTTITSSKTVQDLLNTGTPHFKKTEDYQAIAESIIDINTKTINALKAEYLSYLRSQ